MKFMQESLGHGNLKTTQNYFAGFDDEEKPVTLVLRQIWECV